MKIACINVDVDPLICYYAIHGIETSGISEDPIYLKGIRRFLELFDKNSIKGTFFITAHGFSEKNSEILREIVRSGHEIADHSFSHNYQLTRMAKDEIFQEIKKNKDFLEETTGIKCLGFRSPGYNSSQDLISVLKSVGYTYDSSLFPSISYYLAKWLLINLKKLSGIMPFANESQAGLRLVSDFQRACTVCRLFLPLPKFQKPVHKQLRLHP